MTSTCTCTVAPLYWWMCEHLNELVYVIYVYDVHIVQYSVKLIVNN